ncbi:50S ribosomal protein L23 [Beggiatoa leptomitoformis]|uniref:Large ribosomal subunit protein uL23 n=1 Tax=Beggiatoa leptomitoformis TaxID=288004 RepID=A0A2N9YFB3_9GAMM|nr:50S ribosomal protein L23 [Beggiatoa leptomitoformis]ALG68596.1 50S ribosomal protein L23 [Beggiatoa leptomitoformis]AUI69059.1 50S ribosomal protein L23 [Beggiatoa leptomitoformis]
MNKARLMQVLLAPHISEKATQATDKNQQYVFQVLPTATKQEIKAAVELLFNVKVTNVQTVCAKGKRKNFGRTRGKRSDWKKAYVGLQEGFDINFSGN